MIAGTRTRNPESNALLLGTFVNAGMGLAGLAVYLITDIQALLLDAAFTIISVVSGIVSILVSRTSSRRSARYPYGRFALESLYMLAKSALIIALMGLTLWKVSVKAYAYLRSGTGEAMNVGPVIIYEIVMVSCGFCLYAFFRFRNRQMNKHQFTASGGVDQCAHRRIDVRWHRCGRNRGFADTSRLTVLLPALHGRLLHHRDPDGVHHQGSRGDVRAGMV